MFTLFNTDCSPDEYEATLDALVEQDAVREGADKSKIVVQYLGAEVEVPRDAYKRSIQSARVDCWSRDGSAFSVMRRWTTDDKAERRKAAYAWQDGDTDTWSRYTAPVGWEIVRALAD